VAHFFFKSAQKVLESQKQPVAGQKSGQAATAGASGNRKDLTVRDFTPESATAENNRESVNKTENQPQGASSGPSGSDKKNVSLDSIF
jgi:hypothetical protein